MMQCGFAASVCASGIQVNKTRIVFNEGDVKSTVVISHIENEDDTISSKSFVIETAVYDSLNQDNLSQQFYSAPNVFTLSGEQSTVVSIIPIDDISLLSGNELLYYFGVNVYSLENEGEMIRSLYKVLYRNSKIKYKPINNDSLLLFRKQKAALTITNPTPYYVAIGNLYVDDKIIDESLMLPPLSETDLLIENPENSRLIKWNAIDDYGGLTQSYLFEFK